MCGRYTVARDAEAVAAAFDADAGPLREVALPRYNVAPTDAAPVVIAAPEGRRAGPMRWGLLPHWAKRPRDGARMINARSETVGARRAYRESFLARRCLVPADGFYEWEARASGRQPYWIHRPGARLFAMAGIWSKWRPRGGPGGPRGAVDGPGRGAAVATFSILTRAAPASIRWLHDRAPVILRRRDWDAWLAPDAAEPALDALLRGAAAPELLLHPVSRAVNRAGHDEPACVETVELAEEATLFERGAGGG